LNELMENALEYKNREEWELAAEAFASIAEKYPDYAPAFGMCGAVLFSGLKKPREALPYCTRAVELAPKSEMASLALFHSLWALERDDEAIAEMKRFLQVGYCEDYVEIIQAMHDEWVGKDKRPRKKTKKAKTKP